MCNKTEYTGHPEGMLDRDLRTTKTRVYNSSEEVRERLYFSKQMTGSFIRRSAKIDNHHCCHPSRTKSHFKWRKGYSLQHYIRSKYILFIINFISNE